MGDSFYGCRQLCRTYLKDFDKIQRLGSDQIYKRYSSLEAILRNNIAEEYRDFPAKPDFDPNYGSIVWYGVEWKEKPRLLLELEGEERAHYESILEETQEHYRRAVDACQREDELATLAGILSSIDERFVYCYDDKVVAVAWGMREKKRSEVLPLDELIDNPDEKRPIPPVVTPVEEPTPPEETHVEEEEQVDPEESEETHVEEEEPEEPDEAIRDGVGYTEELIRITFDPGEHGRLKKSSGLSQLSLATGTVVAAGLIPGVKSKRGYKFVGWSPSITEPITEDTCFTAQYRKKKGTAWWKWLLWILLILLGLWLLLWLLQGGCSDRRDDYGRRIYDPIPADSVGLIEQVPGEGGEVRDDNGRVRDILDEDGQLPDVTIIAPITGEDGKAPEVIDSDDQIPILSDRLNIFLTDSDADLQQWVNDFKAQYPDAAYRVIGWDPNVQLIQIQVPADEREAIGKRLPDELPRQPFFVVDEAIMDHNGVPTEGRMSVEERGWHLKAVHAPRLGRPPGEATMWWWL